MTISYCDACGNKIDCEWASKGPRAAINPEAGTWINFDVCDQCLHKLGNIFHYAKFSDPKARHNVP